MTKWRRVDARGTARVVCAVVAVVGTGVSAVMLVDLLTQPSAEVARGTGVALLLTACAYRIYLTGVYLRPGQIRVRSLHRTRTVNWRDVSMVDSRVPTFTVAHDRRTHAIYVVLTDGRAIQTPIEGVVPGEGPPYDDIVLDTASYHSLLTWLQSVHRTEVGLSDSSPPN